MKTIIVDDNKYSLLDAKACFEQIPDLQIVGYFTSCVAALDFIENNPVELAILDIDMPVMNGTELAGKINDYKKNIQIIFLTGYDTYALEAFRLNVVTYLMKPCDLIEAKAAIKRAYKLAYVGSDTNCIDNIRYCTEIVSKHNTRVLDTVTKPFIKTFGRFDILIDKVPIHFAYAKAKELLAVLVDSQGGTVSMEKAISFLWEDRPLDDKAKQLYRKTVCILRKVLQDYNIEDICFYYRAGIAMDISKVDCDLYRFLNGDLAERRNYNGLYLPDYSWSEETNGELEHLK